MSDTGQRLYFYCYISVWRIEGGHVLGKGYNVTASDGECNAMFNCKRILLCLFDFLLDWV